MSKIKLFSQIFQRGVHILCISIIFRKSSKVQQHTRMWFVSLSNSHLQAISFS